VYVVLWENVCKGFQLVTVYAIYVSLHSLSYMISNNNITNSRAPFECNTNTNTNTCDVNKERKLN
jgi:hypothetical protein